MKLKIGSDFSGIGAFDYAMKRIAEAKGFEIENVFACDMDKFARISYLENHGNPGYYPVNVYDRPIPEQSLDVYMTSPPCQAFSLAGKRLGKDDERGILFFNSLEFIQKNKPRFFIFENVKGLLSDDNGKTFSEWINHLAGKTINGQPVLFPYENCVPYHVYWDILNAKHHGIPQNRERVFIIGIRDDVDNDFRFPKTEHLQKCLNDIVEHDVPAKYYLSEKLLSYFINNSKKMELKKNGFRFKPKHLNEIAFSLTTKQGIRMDDNYIIHSNTKNGFDVMTENDTLNFSVPNSKTRRGRIGKNVAQTLDTQCNQAVIDINNQKKIRKLTPRECLRLMDFPDEFKIVVSDVQIYKQAGNSIVVRVLEKILSNLKLTNK